MLPGIVARFAVCRVRILCFLVCIRGRRRSVRLAGAHESVSRAGIRYRIKFLVELFHGVDSWRDRRVYAGIIFTIETVDGHADFSERGFIERRILGTSRRCGAIKNKSGSFRLGRLVAKRKLSLPPQQ